MVLQWITVGACVPWGQNPEPPQLHATKGELEKRGAVFRPVGLYAVIRPDFLGLSDKEKSDLRVLHVKYSHVVLETWKGEREDWKYLRDLPNLKEIVWGGRHFHDGWCKEIETFTQLEGLFFHGKLTDRGLAVVEKLPNLVALSLLDTNITDDGLRHLKNLKKLRWLSLNGCRNVTDKGLVHLKGLTNLEDLNLEMTKTTSKGMAHLKGLTKLKRIRLSDYADQAFAELGKPKPKEVGLKQFANLTELRRIDGSSRVVSDDDLKSLARLTKLEILNLRSTDISDEGLAHLVHLKSLKELELYGTGVTNQGLSHLRKLTKLESLELGLTLVDDGAIEHLRTMTHLRYLGLFGTEVSKQGIEKLRRALPRTKIRGME